MFTQFSEISARFIQADKSKGVKRLLFSNVNYVKNAIFENYFEQFSHFSTV